MRPKEAKGRDIVPYQVGRSAFGAPCPATKGEVIFTSISIVMLLTSVAYTVNWIIIGT
jgi:hypothetical protein